MRPGETIGMLFIAAGVIVLVMKYSLPGLHWFGAGVLLAGIGMAIIWFSARQRKIRDMRNDRDDIYLDHRRGSHDESGISADD